MPEWKLTVRWKTWTDSGEQRADAPGVAREASYVVVGLQLTGVTHRTTRKREKGEKRRRRDVVESVKSG